MDVGRSIEPEPSLCTDGPGFLWNLPLLYTFRTIIRALAAPLNNTIAVESHWQSFLRLCLSKCSLKGRRGWYERFRLRKIDSSKLSVSVTITIQLGGTLFFAHRSYQIRVKRPWTRPLPPSSLGTCTTLLEASNRRFKT